MREGDQVEVELSTGSSAGPVHLGEHPTNQSELRLDQSASGRISHRCRKSLSSHSGSTAANWFATQCLDRIGPRRKRRRGRISASQGGGNESLSRVSGLERALFQRQRGRDGLGAAARCSTSARRWARACGCAVTVQVESKYLRLPWRLSGERAAAVIIRGCAGQWLCLTCTAGSASQL